MDRISELLNQYGYIILFISLMLELIALPTPGESFMTYCGLLVYEGKLNWIISIIAATSGVIIGITVSYIIGRFCGYNFFKKYGKYIHLGPEKIDKASLWFDKYGNVLMLVGYFIPGFRHITGYFPGVTKMPYKKFALYSYTGALIWTCIFISLGTILGPEWEKYQAFIKRYLYIGGGIAGVTIVCIYLYKINKKRIMKGLETTLDYSYHIFHSLGKVRIAVSGMALIFLSLIIVVVGMIQDVLANEFVLFDQITSYIVGRTFPSNWRLAFLWISYSTNYFILLPLFLLLLIWILRKGENPLLETGSLLLTLVGGEMLEVGLLYLFHRMGPASGIEGSKISYTFPSNQTLMVLVAYGFGAYIILRHINKHWINWGLLLITITICILTGISSIYFNRQYPSDVLAGYVFGGAWLSINIVMLEILRILPKLVSYKTIKVKNNT